MDDPDLARLEHENMVEWVRLSAIQVDGSLIRVDGGIGSFLTGLPAPLFNQVLVVDDDATDAAMADSVRMARDRRDRFCVVLRRGEDERFVSVMADLKLSLDDYVIPGMALHPIPATIDQVHDGRDIRVVGDAAALDDHIRAAAVGFGFPEPMARAVIREALLTHEGCTLYVGYDDGAPVSAGYSIRTSRTLGIFTIATVPAARGRGHGAAMTARLVSDGVAAGCDVAALQASEMGRPVYERLGFRLVQEYDVYLDGAEAG